MLSALVGLALRQRLLVALAALCLAAWGATAYRSLPIDAFPDVAPVQVLVSMRAPGLPPQLRLALSRYKLRRSLNQPVSIEDDPDLQRLLELEKAWNASLPQPAATLPETASTSQPPEPEPAPAPPPEPAAPRPPAARTRGARPGPARGHGRGPAGRPPP